MSLRSSAAHVFVADLDQPVLAARDHHHLARVLRLQAGETVTVSDGNGGWRACAWTGAAGEEGALEPAADVVQEQPPVPEVTIGFALTKGQRGDWVVQKLTEIGVDRIVPLVAARSVVRWDAPTAAGHVERWRRLAREAAMQSRRVNLPKVEEIAPFADLVSVHGGIAGGAVLADPAGESPSLASPSVLVGPEGGWTGEELGAGLPTVSLASTILRAETAALVAGALLCSLRAQLIGAAPQNITLSGASTAHGDEVRLPETGG